VAVMPSYARHGAFKRPARHPGRVAGMSACPANGGRIEPQRTAPGRVADTRQADI